MKGTAQSVFGTEERVRRVYAAHGEELYRLAVGILGDLGLAEEAVQETFVRAWRRAARASDPPIDPGPWLLGIHREVLAELTRARAAQPSFAADLLPGPGPTGPVDDAALDEATRTWRAEEALRSLGEEHRAVLLAVVLRGRSCDEVARHLGVPPDALRRRLLHALRAFRLAHAELARAADATARRDAPGFVDAVLGRVDPSEQATLDRALAHDPTARAELDALRDAVAVLGAADARRMSGDDPPPAISLVDRVVWRIEGERQRERHGVVRRVLRIAIAAMVVAAAFAFVLLITFRPWDFDPVARTVTLDAIEGAGTGTVELRARSTGTEVRLDAAGLDDGVVHSVRVLDDEGDWVAAGTRRGGGVWVGTVAPAVSAIARVEVLDPDGVVVLAAELADPTADAG